MPSRLRVCTSILFVVVLLLAGCRAAVSTEDARKVAATFDRVGLLPPPRLDEDPIAILGQLRDQPEVEAKERALTDTSPPPTSDPAVLAHFYRQRGLAAGGAGRMRQRLEDLTLAVSFSDQVRDPKWDPGFYVLDLARAELHARRRPAAARRLEAFVAANPQRAGHLVTAAYFLVSAYTEDGYVDRAERALRQGMTAWHDILRRPNQSREAITNREAQMELAQGVVRNLKGEFPAAIAAYRRAAAVLVRDPVTAASNDLPEVATSLLAGALARHGALAEAEIEARRALLGTLRKRGGSTTLAADMTNTLAWILLQQGRHREAEALARAAQQTLKRLGTSDFGTRATLLGVLAATGRWDDALREYDAMVRTGRWEDAVVKQRFFSNPDTLIALIHGNRTTEAIAILQPTVGDNRRRFGPRHPVTAMHRALLAVATGAQGESGAVPELQDVMPVLLDRSLDIDEEMTTRAAADRQREFVVGRYIGLLADQAAAGGPNARNASAEAFRLAETIRGRSVARALNANAARDMTSIPELSTLVRESQDARKRIETLYGAVLNVLSERPEDQDQEQIRRLQGQIETLQKARQALDWQITQQYPAYAQLLTPPATTLEHARRVLKPGEALISTLVTEHRTFLWAFSREGPVAFSASPIGAGAVRGLVDRLRRAVDTPVRSLGDIPPFDVDTAYAVYREILEPVKAGWGHADTLLIIPHGALGQLPFAALPMEPSALSEETGILFARYRAVPWLARRYATVVLPSAGALVTLRSMTAAPANRRSFIGFGNPYFSPDQARRARSMPEPPAEIEQRRLKIDATRSARLADLPPLPDTAEEIRAIAATLHADSARDVFLGERASEGAVRAANLAQYRVIAFATHGLSPGDVEGLAQPALALSAPEVADGQGDGLLTMEKILGLRLNADWVVLSACNTAASDGAGTDAISGLGRAFFYAGARALLVTSWAVETTSTRLLTTGLFRRQESAPGLARAQALRQTMLDLIDRQEFIDPGSRRVVSSYAHPLFWASFILVGDGGSP